MINSQQQHTINHLALISVQIESSEDENSGSFCSLLGNNRVQQIMIYDFVNCISLSSNLPDRTPKVQQHRAHLYWTCNYIIYIIFFIVIFFTCETSKTLMLGNPERLNSIPCNCQINSEMEIPQTCNFHRFFSSFTC